MYRSLHWPLGESPDLSPENGCTGSLCMLSRFRWNRDPQQQDLVDAVVVCLQPFRGLEVALIAEVRVESRRGKVCFTVVTGS